jgi:EAL domain-containing protein (putative c-di-GMP-specific phosphodiesterase class I)
VTRHILALDVVTESESLELTVSVNIAAYHLQQADFVDRLATLLAAYPSVPPNLLELEVLESSALDDIGNVSSIIAACAGLGVSFAVDDFGTGYSSLTYLKRLPARVLKIDQSFVRDMLSDPDDLAIIDGVLGLSASFGRQVVAEGVETVDHGVALLQLGCELAQGFGIARPMPAKQLVAWYEAWIPDLRWTQVPRWNRATPTILPLGSNRVSVVL